MNRSLMALVAVPLFATACASSEVTDELAGETAAAVLHEVAADFGDHQRDGGIYHLRPTPPSTRNSPT